MSPFIQCVYAHIRERNLGVHINVVRLCTITFPVYTFAPIYMYIQGNPIYMYIQGVNPIYMYKGQGPYTRIYRVYTRGRASHINVQYTSMYNHVSSVYVRSRIRLYMGSIRGGIYGVYTRAYIRIYAYIRGVYTGSRMTCKRSIYVYIQSYTRIYGVYTRGYIRGVYTGVYTYIRVYSGCIHGVTNHISTLHIRLCTLTIQV